MSSAVTEAATWETSVIGPDGTDLISAAGVRTGLQDLANRTKFLKESFLDVQTYSGIVANSTSSTSFAAIGGAVQLTFTNVEIGDKIVLLGSVPVIAVAGAPFGLLRWFDASASVGDAEVSFETGASMGQSVLLLGQTTVAADAASYVCSVQWRVLTATTTEVETSSITPILLYGVRFRMGA
jgi:hypothetical protein